MMRWIAPASAMLLVAAIVCGLVWVASLRGLLHCSPDLAGVITAVSTAVPYSLKSLLF